MAHVGSGRRRDRFSAGMHPGMGAGGSVVFGRHVRGRIAHPRSGKHNFPGLLQSRRIRTAGREANAILWRELRNWTWWNGGRARTCQCTLHSARDLGFGRARRNAPAPAVARRSETRALFLLVETE